MLYLSNGSTVPLENLESTLSIYIIPLLAPTLIQNGSAIHAQWPPSPATPQKSILATDLPLHSKDIWLDFVSPTISSELCCLPVSVPVTLLTLLTLH